MLEIIIVDDHRIYRESLGRIVKRIYPNSKIYEAENGMQFLQLLSNLHFIDIVLMDIKMPVMDGIEATRKAVSLYPDLKILGLSMYPSNENKQSIIEAGARGFLMKGGDKVGIKGAIEMVLTGGT